MGGAESGMSRGVSGQIVPLLLMLTGQAGVFSQDGFVFNTSFDQMWGLSKDSTLKY